MKKIALLPGGFKPPHAGHYNMAKWLAKNTDADTVIVKVGAKERDGVTRDMSLQLWNLYKDSDPDPISAKILIQASTSPSPVRDVYDFVEKEAPEGSTIYLGMGEKDINDARFKNIGKFAEPRGIQFQTQIVPPQAGGVSGTDMRGFIKNMQDTFFYNALPDHMTTMDKEDAWAIVIPNDGNTLNESLDEGVRDFIVKNKKNLQSLLTNFKNAWGDQKGSFKGYKGLVTKFLNDKNSLDTEEKAKLKQNTQDIFKTAGIIFSYPILGVTGNLLIAFLVNKISSGQLSTLPSHMSHVVGEDLYDPNDHVSDYMKSSEWKAGMPDGPKKDINPSYKYHRAGLYGKMYNETVTDTDINLYPFKITDKTYDEEDNSLITTEYKFITPNNTYRIEFYSGEYNPEVKTFDLSFGVDKGELNTIDTFQMTGEGNARKIFKTILNITKDFINKEDVNKIVVDGTDEKRKRIYKTIFSSTPPEISDKIELKEAILNETVEDPAAVREIDEDPQFGVLYHWTSYLACKKIIESNKLKSNKSSQFFEYDESRDLPDYKNVVFFTVENERFADEENSNQCILVVDKSKLSKDYKVISYGDPYEETIVYTNDPSIPILPYLKGVLLMNTLQKPAVKKMVEFLESKGIPYEINDNLEREVKANKAKLPSLKKELINKLKLKYPNGFIGYLNTSLLPFQTPEYFKKESTYSYPNITINKPGEYGEKNKFQIQFEIKPQNLEKYINWFRYSPDSIEDLINMDNYEGEELWLKGDIPIDINTLNEAILNETVTEHDIICDNCGWTWGIVDGGDDLYICHTCGHDNTPDKMNELDDREVKYWALYADLVKKLDVPNPEEAYQNLSNRLTGESLEALNYFYNTYFKNEPPFDLEMTEAKLFSQNWWKEQLTEVLSEAKANTHLTHLEELVLTQGQDGYNQAKSFLYELIKNLKGEDNSIKNVSVKWDGAPAIFTGINPDNGQFFVGTKSVFNKEPKINYTSEDVDRNHGHAPGLAVKLKLALEYLPPLGITGILQGDFMFDNNEVETNDIDGVSHYTFRPNTIRYAVEANSELGNKILSAKIGVIFHTTYKDLNGSGASFGADVSGLKQSNDVWFDDAYFKDATGVLLSNEEEQLVLAKISEADSIGVNYDELPMDISSNAKINLLNTYLNSEIRRGEFITDPQRSFEMFREWYQERIEKAVAKISPKNQEKKRIQYTDKLQTFESKKDVVINLFRVSKLLSEAKNIFIAKYDKAVATKHFIDNGDGTLSVTKAEGFVAVDHTESGIKLVDRLEFSRNNFNAGKPGAKK